MTDLAEAAAEPALLEFDVTLTPADVIALNRHVARKSRARIINAMLLAASLAAALVGGQAAWPERDFVPGILMVWTALALFLCLHAAFRKVIYRHAYGDSSYMFASRRFVIDGRGLRVITTHTEGVVAWAGISRVVKTPRHVFLFLPGNGQGYTFPARALPPDLTLPGFAAQLRAWHEQARAAAS